MCQAVCSMLFVSNLLPSWRNTSRHCCPHSEEAEARRFEELVQVPWVVRGRVEVWTQVCMTVQPMLVPTLYADPLRAGMRTSFCPLLGLLHIC